MFPFAIEGLVCLWAMLAFKMKICMLCFDVQVLFTLCIVFMFTYIKFTYIHLKILFFFLRFLCLMTKSLMFSLPRFGFVFSNSDSVLLPVFCLLHLAYSLIILLNLFMLVTPANKEFNIFLPAGLGALGLSGLGGLFGLGIASWGGGWGGSVGCLSGGVGLVNIL